MAGSSTRLQDRPTQDQQLRTRAERALGQRFDIREFHDELLSDGALALDVLENKMRSWTDRESETHS